MTRTVLEKDTEATSTRTKRVFLLVAVVFIGLAVSEGVTSNVVAVMVGLLTLASLVFFDGYPRSALARREEVTLLVSVLVFGLLGAVGYGSSSIGSTSQLLRQAGLIWIVMAACLYFLRPRLGAWQVVAAVVGVTLAVSALAGVMHIEASRGFGFDVLFLHKEAAEAIAEGENPYTNAVTFPNGAPSAGPGDQIVGYVYPPVTAVAYAAGQWLFGDPRYTSLAAWVGTLMILGLWAIRRPASHLPYLMVLLAALPGWSLVLRAAWTEPFSLLMMALAIAVWRSPGRSGLWTGLALASKQYFAVVAPVLLFHRGHRSRRLLVAGLGVVVAVGLGVVWDPVAFWNAAIDFHANTPPRLDSSNLVGLLGKLDLLWDPPTWLPILVGVSLAFLASFRARSPSAAMAASALALGGSFFVSSQAFANYWFMVMGLCLLALVTLENEPEAAQGTQAVTISRVCVEGSGSDR